ncbi:NUDIX domain-containing protein [Candidatus Roizmanbacteria bacterium]|nr:NUDIX domain-containing protein [Candidatus Roizmanbacteria bacterium]
MKVRTEISAGGVVYQKTADNTLWLITQHSKHKGWSFPKGLVGDTDKGEKKETAAVREVEEEGGVKARITDKASVSAQYKYRFGDFLVRKTVHYFLMEYLSGDPKNHDWEVSDAKFVSEAEVKNTLSFRSDKDAFSKILKLYKTLCTQY